jgi:hypothetical protein
MKITESLRKEMNSLVIMSKAICSTPSIGKNWTKQNDTNKMKWTKEIQGRSKMAIATQLQIMWALWTRDFSETWETLLAEVKHQGELKQHSEPLAHVNHLHSLLKEQLVLHANPHPIGLRRHYSAGCGIYDPWACSSAPPGPCSPKLPPLRLTWSPLDWASKACQASVPQAVMIITPPGAPLRPAKLAIHRHTHSPLCQTCTLQAHQAHAPKSC